MILKKDYLIALKRLVFSSETRRDMAIVLDYLSEKEARAFDKADCADNFWQIKGTRKGYDNVRAALAMTPTQLDIEMDKEKSK